VTPRSARLFPAKLAISLALYLSRAAFGLVDAVALARWAARQRSDEEMDALVEMLDGCNAPGAIGVWS
jgi:hypothetical protein